MILGIGCDIIESERIERLLTETEKTGRIFTESERKYCDGKGKERTASYAVRFAAKEAAAKAFGCGIGPVSWTEIETVKETGGAPYFRFYGKAEDKLCCRLCDLGRRGTCLKLPKKRCRLLFLKNQRVSVPSAGGHSDARR